MQQRLVGYPGTTFAMLDLTQSQLSLTKSGCGLPRSLSMDVGVDTHDLRPWHFDEIADIMRKKAEAPALASDH
jgi:hypothetical protein